MAKTNRTAKKAAVRVTPIGIVAMAEQELEETDSNGTVLHTFASREELDRHIAAEAARLAAWHRSRTRRLLAPFIDFPN